MHINLTIPVYNEEAQLASSVARVLAVLDACPQHRYEVVIAENGSTDRTAEIARELAAWDPRVRVAPIAQKGRGGALKQAWLESGADLLAYMDVDLSTDLEAWPRLLQPIIGGTHDLVTGSRLVAGSRIKRSWRREFLSRGYSLLARWVVRAPCRDLQCGFKALRKSTALALLPQVQDTGWFFDTELIVLAARAGDRVMEIPITWVEDPDSRVRIVSTALADLRGLARLWLNS